LIYWIKSRKSFGAFCAIGISYEVLGNYIHGVWFRNATIFLLAQRLITL
jgi:hypothetical protein